MAEITTEYRGFTITYEEYKESWASVLSDGRLYSREKLADVKKKIDGFLKAESEFKDVEAISLYTSWGRDSELGCRTIITSVAADGDVWTNRDGKREKVSKKMRDTLCKVTPKNEAKIQEVKELIAKKDDVLREIESVKASMERIFTTDTPP